jgi:hypothetical protein
MKKPSVEQLFVLRKLAADFHVNGPAAGKIAYYKGGYWSTPGFDDSNDPCRLSWHMTRPSVEAMERAQWLRKLDTSSNYDILLFPALPDHQITPLGLALVAEIREEPQRYDPDDGKIHVRTSSWEPTAKPVLCGRTGAASVSSASGFWGPDGVGFPDVCRKCYEIQRGRLTGKIAG